MAENKSSQGNVDKNCEAGHAVMELKNITLCHTQGIEASDKIKTTDETQNYFVVNITDLLETTLNITTTELDSETSGYEKNPSNDVSADLFEHSDELSSPQIELSSSQIDLNIDKQLSSSQVNSQIDETNIEISDSNETNLNRIKLNSRSEAMSNELEDDRSRTKILSNKSEAMSNELEDDRSRTKILSNKSEAMSNELEDHRLDCSHCESKDLTEHCHSEPEQTLRSSQLEVITENNPPVEPAPQTFRSQSFCDCLCHKSYINPTFSFDGSTIDARGTNNEVFVPTLEVNVVTNEVPSSSSRRDLPHYGSLSEYILHDEPPKYEDVTGIKLATELEVQETHRPPSANRIRFNCRTRTASVMIFIAVVLVTILLVYLSITGADSNGTNGTSGGESRPR